MKVNKDEATCDLNVGFDAQNGEEIERTVAAIQHVLDGYRSPECRGGDA